MLGITIRVGLFPWKSSSDGTTRRLQDPEPGAGGSSSSSAGLRSTQTVLFPGISLETILQTVDRLSCSCPIVFLGDRGAAPKCYTGHAWRLVGCLVRRSFLPPRARKGAFLRVKLATSIFRGIITNQRCHLPIISKMNRKWGRNTSGPNFQGRLPSALTCR